MGRLFSENKVNNYRKVLFVGIVEAVIGCIVLFTRDSKIYDGPRSRTTLETFMHPKNCTSACAFHCLPVALAALVVWLVTPRIGFCQSWAESFDIKHKPLLQRLEKDFIYQEKRFSNCSYQYSRESSSAKVPSQSGTIWCRSIGDQSFLRQDYTRPTIDGEHNRFTIKTPTYEMTGIYKRSDIEPKGIVTGIDVEGGSFLLASDCLLPFYKFRPGTNVRSYIFSPAKLSFSGSHLEETNDSSGHRVRICSDGTTKDSKGKSEMVFVELDGHFYLESYFSSYKTLNPESMIVSDNQTEVRVTWNSDLCVPTTVVTRHVYNGEKQETKVEMSDFKFETPDTSLFDPKSLGIAYHGPKRPSWARFVWGSVLGSAVVVLLVYSMIQRLKRK